MHLAIECAGSSHLHHLVKKGILLLVKTGSFLDLRHSPRLVSDNGLDLWTRYLLVLRRITMSCTDDVASCWSP